VQIIVLHRAESEVCFAYDVVFHPETIEKSKKNTRFQDFLINIAMEQVQKAHKIELSKSTLFCNFAWT